MEANLCDITTTKPLKKKRKINLLKKHLSLTLLVLPGLIYLIINNYIPMFGSIIAFKDFDPSLGILGSEWVGFDNFKYLFLTSDAYIITRNTLLYNGLFIILNAATGITVAILLNEIRRKLFLKFYQSAVLIPFLISFVVVSYLVYGLLSPETGFMNKTIMPLFGLEPIQWYMESKFWPLILIFINTWKFVGYNCVIYFASIMGIDQEYYEAATLDGASKWRQIIHITIPTILPVIVMLALIGVGRIFYSDFGLFYQVPMNQGILTDVTNVIDTYVYRSLMLVGDYGMSSAAGLYQGAVGFVLVIVVNLIVRKINKENALF
jgi:putative aldouronate transport system permease protein